jgi:hypothetical protein
MLWPSLWRVIRRVVTTLLWITVLKSCRICCKRSCSGICYCCTRKISIISTQCSIIRISISRRIWNRNTIWRRWFIALRINWSRIFVLLSDFLVFSVNRKRLWVSNYSLSNSDYFWFVMNYTVRILWLVNISSNSYWIRITVCLFFNDLRIVIDVICCVCGRIGCITVIVIVGCYCSWTYIVSICVW